MAEKIEKSEFGYACAQCGKVFSVKDKLTRHVECVHENLRPFQCPWCESRFNRKDKMRAHFMSVHMQEKPFQCNYCTFSCPRKYRMKEHINKTHVGKYEEDFTYTPPSKCVKESVEEVFVNRSTQNGAPGRSNEGYFAERQKVHRVANIGKTEFIDVSKLT